MDENQNEVNYGMDPANNGDVNQQSTSYNGLSTGGANGLAIASLVCGILSIVSGCCFFFIGFIPSILAIVLACVGKGKADKTRKKIAIAGLICGIIGLVISIIASILFILHSFYVIKQGLMEL